MNIREKFLEHAQEELKEYIDKLMKLEKDEIILQAYEIHIKKELFWFFEAEENEKDLSKEDYTILFNVIKEKYLGDEFKILEFLFNDISSRDEDPVSNYYTILNYIKGLVHEMKEKN